MGEEISGLKCKVYIEDATTTKILAGQRNATFSFSAVSIGETSNDTEENWKENLLGFKEFFINCDCAFVQDYAAYNILKTKSINSENVNVYIEFPFGTRYKGNTTITDFSSEMPYEDLITYNISLQGSGALTVAEKVPFK